jgi:hypothetical protein
MVKKEKKSYFCQYTEQAPLGAAGWLSSDLINNKAFAETRFLDYSKKDADALIYDVNAKRNVLPGKAKDKEFYFNNTSFYMVYDKFGWHIFVLCGEKNLESKRIENKNLGALEMSFAPTPDNAYTQWIISLNNGKVDYYSWNLPNRKFRLPENYVKTETVFYKDKIATYIFFPWEYLYDKLPFSSEKDWLFEIIRWSPAGGISWSGGKVHNTGKWGSITWQKPAGPVLADIKKALLVKAWAKYRKTKINLIDNYWARRDFGDPEFLQDALIPEVNRLNKIGKKIDSIDQFSNKQTSQMYHAVVSDWMEFEYKVSHLRKQYLKRCCFRY